MNKDAIIFIVDDDFRMRESLSSFLSSLGLRVAVFGSASEFLMAKRPDCPACLILDLQLPDKDGLQLQQELAAQDAPPIIFITGHGNVPTSVQAMKAGAIEFLPKPFAKQDLLTAIQAGIALDRTARKERSEIAELRERYKFLTPREREVFSFVVAGFANKQTASDLGTSLVTVGVQRSQVMRKMKARSLAELVRIADKLSIVRTSKPSK